MKPDTVSIIISGITDPSIIDPFTLNRVYIYIILKLSVYFSLFYHESFHVGVLDSLDIVLDLLKHDSE